SRRHRPGDDQARRHGARRHPRRHCPQVRPAGTLHRRRGRRRQSRNLRGRRLRRGDCRKALMASDETKADAEASWAELKAPLIRLALELGPLVVFFVVNTLGERWLEQSPLLSNWFSQPIILATAV